MNNESLSISGSDHETDEEIVAAGTSARLGSEGNESESSEESSEERSEESSEEIEEVIPEPLPVLRRSSRKRHVSV